MNLIDDGTLGNIQDVANKMYREINQKKNELLNEALKKHGIDLEDFEKDHLRRFNRYKCEVTPILPNNSMRSQTTWWANDGTDDGKRLVTIQVTLIDFKSYKIESW